MTGTGGAGGDRGEGTDTTAPGGDGGTGGIGVRGGTLAGIDLTGVTAAWLTDTTMSLSMTGNGGAGGAGGAGGDSTNGGVGGSGGAGGTGIGAGLLTGINLSHAGSVQLTGTTLSASMTGNGGIGAASGGLEGTATAGGIGGTGMEGDTLTAIDLSGASKAWLGLAGPSVVAAAGPAGRAGWRYWRHRRDRRHWNSWQHAVRALPRHDAHSRSHAVWFDGHQRDAVAGNAPEGCVRPAGGVIHPGTSGPSGWIVGERRASAQNDTAAWALADHVR